MSKPNFTPGPWKINSNIGRKGELGVLADSAPCIVAVMGNAKAWPVQAEANARLIAAAPSLYGALAIAAETLEALTLGTVPLDERYSVTCRASEQINAALALVEAAQ